VPGNVTHLGGLPNFLDASGIGGFGTDEIQAQASRHSGPIFARFRRGEDETPQHVEDGNGGEVSNKGDGLRSQRARPSYDGVFNYGQSDDPY
jgi:hypothetical protein